LASRLKKGGVLFIIDKIKEPDNSFAKLHHMHHQHPSSDTVAHDGFDEWEIREAFRSAGVEKNFMYSIIEKPLILNLNGDKIESTIFAARGDRS
jgi:hypothetical protein